MALILKHQTRAQFLARLREDYRGSERDRTVHLGDRVLAMIGSGDLTDAELRAAFGLSVAQWAAAKARMQTRVNARQTIRAAVGE